ncbi:MAG: hypothetical protein RIQ89_1224 [Bacteroidota bacterium]|jgi:hypothetical protein
MIVYSVTINVDHSIAKQWLQWMRTKHIYDVVKAGNFLDFKLLQLMGDQDSGGLTYNVQYYCKDLAAYQKYEKDYAPKLRAEAIEIFGDKFVAFRTLLDVIE